MKYVIKHSVLGLYTGHIRVPRFRRKRELDQIVEFPSLEDARAVLKNRREYPGLEDCTIESQREE